MGLATSTTRNAIVNAVSERLEAPPDTGVEHVQLFRREASEAEPTRELVGRKRSRPNQFAQGPVSGPQEHFQAERPVLSLTKSERIPSVVVGLGFYVRDAVPVSPDEHLTANPRHDELAARCWEPPSQHEPKEQFVNVHVGLHCAQGLLTLPMRG